MIQYEVQLRWGYRITPIEIEKETEKSIWVNGKRRMRGDAYNRIFPTLKEAKQFMVERCKREIAGYEKNLSEVRLALSNLEAIKCE